MDHVATTTGHALAGAALLPRLLQLQLQLLLLWPPSHHTRELDGAAAGAGPQLCTDILSGCPLAPPGEARSTGKGVEVTEAPGHGAPQRPGQRRPSLRVTWCPTCPLSCWGTSSRWASRPGCPPLSCCCCWTGAGPWAARAARGAGAAGRRPGGRTARA